MSYSAFMGSRSSLNGTYGHGPMTDDQIRSIAPSVFALDKHDSRSARYSYIPTSEIVAGMRREGFEPVMAKQGGSRVVGKELFTKHMLRFRPAGTDVVARQIGGLYPELVLVNSHDGTSSYKLMAGLMRLVCLNGMLTADRELGNITVHHKGDVVFKVIEGSFTVIQDSMKAIETASNWAEIRLDGAERQILAEAAHSYRFADADGEITTAIEPAQLLRARRAEDRDTSLWTTHNVIQEHVIRGGDTAWGRDANGRQRRTTSRPVNGIDGDVRLNKSLWALSQRMAELKRAA
jgi:hypothetical protein